MNKNEVINKVSIETGFPKSEVSATIESLFSVITRTLEEGYGREAVIFRGFGKFELVERAARKARNPRTNEEIEVPSKYAIKFTAGETLKKITE